MNIYGLRKDYVFVVIVFLSIFKSFENIYIDNYYFVSIYYGFCI